MKSISRGRAACVPSTVSCKLYSYKNAQGWHFRVYPISRPKPHLLPVSSPGLHTKVSREYCSCFFEPPILFVCSIHPFPTNLPSLWSIVPAAATRWQHLRIVLHTLPGPMWNAVLCPVYKSSRTLLSLLSNQLASCLLTRSLCLSKPLTDRENFKGDPTYVHRAQTSPARAGWHWINGMTTERAAW